MVIILLCLGINLSSVHKGDNLSQLQQQGSLRAGVVFSSLSYYVDSQQQVQGFEYKLLQPLADQLNVNLEIQLFPNQQSLLNALVNRRIDIAAAELCNCATNRFITYSNAFLDVDTIAVRHRDTVVHQFADLVEQNITLSIANDSIQQQFIQQLQLQYPQLQIQQLDVTSYELMQQVQNKTIDAALLGKPHFLQKRSFFPHLREFENFDDNHTLVFALPQSEDDSYINKVNEILASLKQSGTIEQIIIDNIHPSQPFDFASALTFKRKINTLLPSYEPLFKVAAQAYGFDWLLLAAMAYQESHWNPKARSYTNVRGLMMLTQVTAEQMGVDNLLDPVQSLQGGTRYLHELYGRLHDHIKEPHRTKMALASYNIGIGHLRDARRLAKTLNKNPNIWEDIALTLPLLSRREYYKWLPYGYARGFETVDYVENIEFYQSILTWHQWQEILNAHYQQKQQQTANRSLQELFTPTTKSTIKFF